MSATPASPTFAATPVPTVVPIPTPTPASALQNVIQPTHTPTPISRSTTYTVQAGDSLSAIAERFGVELDDLIALNEIDDPNVIAVGTVLEITIESTVGAESAVTPKSYVEGHVTPDPSVWERVKHITPRPGIPGLTPRPTSPPRTVTVRGPARSAQFRCLSSTDGASMRAHGQELARLWSALGTLLVLGEEFGVDPIFWTASEKRQFTSQLVSTERIADRIRNLSWKTGWPQSLHNVRNPAVRAAHNVISARQSFAEYDRTARDNALNNGWGALADAAQNWRLAKGAFDRLCR
ncbi:MAG: LysM peptidoglycan-binding domain-containing protein [Chloroflexi bacterium]|nr:LysM peptidoglycan-binding domain-containing protein [Chloroflexota bacterium]